MLRHQKWPSIALGVKCTAQFVVARKKPSRDFSAGRFFAVITVRGPPGTIMARVRGLPEPGAGLSIIAIIIIITAKRVALLSRAIHP